MCSGRKPQYDYIDVSHLDDIYAYIYIYVYLLFDVWVFIFIQITHTDIYIYIYVCIDIHICRWSGTGIVDRRRIAKRLQCAVGTAHHCARMLCGTSGIPGTKLVKSLETGPHSFPQVGHLVCAAACFWQAQRRSYSFHRDVACAGLSC